MTGRLTWCRTVLGLMSSAWAIVRFERPEACHQPTLIAAARSQATASSPRGTFS